MPLQVPTCRDVTITSFHKIPLTEMRGFIIIVCVKMPELECPHCVYPPILAVYTKLIADVKELSAHCGQGKEKIEIKTSL